MDRKIRYFVNGWSFRLSFATRPGYDGDHEDISDGDSYELGEYENSEEALAAAEAFISTHGNEVNDEEDGIGSVPCSQTVTVANMGRSRRSRGTGSCRNAISFPAWEQCPQKQI